MPDETEQERQAEFLGNIRKHVQKLGKMITENEYTTQYLAIMITLRTLEPF